MAGSSNPPAKTAYLSVAQTQSLLDTSHAARVARLAAADMVKTDDAGKLVGVTRVTINTWISQGRCIGLALMKRGYRVPTWQFEPLMWELIPQLTAALGTKEGWALLSFLESPHGALNGLTPRAAIEQGQGERVVKIAAQEGMS